MTRQGREGGHLGDIFDPKASRIQVPRGAVTLLGPYQSRFGVENAAKSILIGFEGIFYL